MRRALAWSAAAALVSLPVALPAPDYDPWSWLLWGREVLHGDLDTRGGPAFKPLPVGVATVLAALGDLAPVLWVLLARWASALAAVLAFRLAHRLAGGSPLAGVAAAAAVLLCGEYIRYAASGMTEGIVLALALAALEAGRVGRRRLALAFALGCGLLRVETWPFLAIAAAATWRRHPVDRPSIAAAAVGLPLAWLLPELVGSGDALRSATRARVPNPGQPALDAVPGLASAREAIVLPLWPLWIGVVGVVRLARNPANPAAREALAVAGAGLAWIALVAAMAHAGFSGEARYAVPGAALVGVAGAVGLVATARRDLPPGRRRAALVAVAALVTVSAAPRTAHLADVRRDQAHQWALQAGLSGAIAVAGGRDAVLACGRPYAGPLRGPLMAYMLGVAKSAVEPDRQPRVPGIVFVSALTPGSAPAPAIPAGFEPVADVTNWQVFAGCGEKPPRRSPPRPSPPAASGDLTETPPPP